MDKWQTCFTQMIQAEEKPLCLFVLQFITAVLKTGLSEDEGWDREQFEEVILNSSPHAFCL